MPVALQNRRHHPRLKSAAVRCIAERVLEGLGESEAELSVVLTGDDAVQELNRTYRNKDKPTDVLSFSLLEGEGELPVELEVRVLGDVVISMDTAARQAESIGHSLTDEVTRLLIHGVLHLLGHDHVNGGLQARRMRDEERRLAEWCRDGQDLTC